MATHTVTPTPRALILGHSFIRRLQMFIEHHIGCLDLSLQITAPDYITWHGIGGRTGLLYCGGGQGVGRGRETGEEFEGAGGGISTMAGSGREIQKGKLLLFVTAYFQSKKRTQQRFLASI